MKGFRRLSIVGLCTLALLVCAAADARGSGEYKTVEVEGLKITMDSEWGAKTTPGYVPVRFDITNLSEARVIQIVGQGMRFFRSSGPFSQTQFTVVRNIRLARGDRVRLTIPVPVYADNENFWFDIRENDNSIERLNYSGFASKSRPEHASALIVATGSEFGTAAGRWLRPMTGAGGMVASGTVLSGRGATAITPRTSASQPLDFMLPPERLPDNWLGFTSLRAVFVGPTEWDALTEPQKNALLTWTACGGDLFLVDKDAATAVAGLVPATAAPGSPRAYFFGRIHQPASASISAAGLPDVLAKAGALQDATWGLPANTRFEWAKIAGRGFLLPIPGIEGVPARAVFFILIVFSVLIGPINYWLLWRARRQVLLVLTTPLISAIFILLLAGYVVAGEGVGVRGRAISFTMLDQARKQAATRASTSLYAAGMAPAGGLRFARDEAVYPLGPTGDGVRESTGMDLTESQQFMAGVIQARSPTNLETISFRPARERLTFSPQAIGFSVSNGLGVTIRTLVYRTGSSVYRSTGPLQAGQTGALTPDMGRSVDMVPTGLPEGLASRFRHLFQNPPDGVYIAVVERSPYWNAGVPSLEERDSFHVVLGWIEGQP